MADAKAMTAERRKQIDIHLKAYKHLGHAWYMNALRDYVVEVERLLKDNHRLAQDVDMYKTGFGIVASKPNQLGGPSDG